jgi:hypothetical protein
LRLDRGEGIGKKHRCQRNGGAEVKKVQPKMIEEFWIVAGADMSVDLGDLKDTCGFYDTAENALVDASVNANPEDDSDGWPQIVYHVQKFVEVK